MCFGNNQQTGSQTGFGLNYTDQTSSTKYDPWATAGSQSTFGGAQNWLQNNPYQAYSGPMSASFGPEFGQASSYLSGQLGQTNPYTTQGAQGISSAMGAIDPNMSISDYMNPYTQGVLDPTLRNLNQAWGDARQQTAANATMAGAYGGTGQGVENALNNKNYGNAVSDATNQAYSQAFQNAQASRSQNLGLLGQLGSSLAGVGQNQFTQGTTLASMLAGMGSTQQQAGQQGIQNAISQNQTNQTMPLNQYGMLAQILSGVPQNSTTQTTGIGSSSQNQQSYAPNNSGFNFLGSALGAAMA